MRTLSAPITGQSTAQQAGWGELYDIYLKAAIVTPWGTTNILRLTDLPGGAAFFTPKLSPEAVANQGLAQAYQFWPIKRATVKGDSKFTNDKVQITASNVSTDWAAMLSEVDWYDTTIIIRKISTTIAAPTADDCAVIWTGEIDAAKVTESQVVFDCSNDLASLVTLAPRENMHTNCRFQWGDDMCTAIRFLPANYKAGTVGAGSTSTAVNSADFTEDTGSAGVLGTDLVNALADASITASSEGGGATSFACTFANYGDMVHGLNYYMVESATLPPTNSRITFSGTSLPGGIVAGKWYTGSIIYNPGPVAFFLYDPDTNLPVPYVSAGISVSYTQFVGAASGAANVKSSKTGYWALSDSTEWGTASQGFYTLPSGMAGLKNMGLKPFINFDFGAAVAPNLWRISSVPTTTLEQLVRLIYLGYSTDNTYWTFLRYFELPPIGGVLYDLLLHGAPAARYWSICVRSQWGAGFKNTLLNKVQAYANSRHYWAWGRLTFAAATTTAALRGVSVRVRESYSGQVIVPKLPAVPVAGDTFIIERGCPRTFNACAERNNINNFGGFTDLPFQTIIR